MTSTLPRCVALGILALNLASACKPHDTGEILPDPNVCTGTSASAAGRVVVQPREQLLATGAKLSLFCSDEIGHPCSNFTLPNTVVASGAALRITFPGAVAPNLCLTSIGPATSQIDLSNLAVGTYALDLYAGTKHTIGTLLIQANRLEVSTCDSNTVAVRNGVLYRIPANTIWGQLYARTPAAQTAALALVDSLRREGAQPITLPTGNYGYFQVNASGQLVTISNLLNGQPTTAIATPVLMSFTGNFARIKGVVRRRAQYNDLSAGINSALGESAF